MQFAEGAGCMQRDFRVALFFGGGSCLESGLRRRLAWSRMDSNGMDAHSPSRHQCARMEALTNHYYISTFPLCCGLYYVFRRFKFDFESH
jgi:hypothetical protein